MARVRAEHPVRNADGSLVQCEDGNVFHSYECTVTLNGNPQECIFADEETGVVVVIEQREDGPDYKAFTGDVKITMHCIACGKEKQ